jgi:phosphoserine phosphatase RsbU/P
MPPQSKRGPDRRRGPGDASPGVQERETERRNGGDRRRNSYVSRLELCRGLSYDHVENILERCPVEVLAPGEVLLEPGQANHYLYFLLTGRLEVRLKSTDSPVADVIEAGECIGEMSIIDGQPTSAYVIATEQSTVIAVHENVFWSKIATSPKAVRNLSRVLTERMRKRNDATLRALEQEMRLEQLQKELLAAYEIQVGMLPQGPQLLPELPNLDVYSRMDVVKSVGGDFYDAFPLDERRVCIAIGDVSGKGMPAALFMVRTVTLLRAELIKSDDLAACVCRFNKALCDTNISHMFVSLIVMRVDILDGTVDYVNAGHSPILVSKGGGPFVAVDDSKGLIAGVLGDNVYEPGRMRLEAGDRMVLYTDGVTEARNETRHFYGLQRLTDFLATFEANDSAHLVNAISEDVHAFSGGASQSDDVTIVVVGYRGAR